MTKTLMTNITRLAFGCSALAFSGMAAAQDANTGKSLEEIIVTAQRRAQSLQDVPISVSTLQGDRVTQFSAGGEDIRLLSSRIAGLNAESSNGRVAPRFYLRGLGNTDFDLAASQPISVIMDDVVQENVVLKSFPLFDVERVEVLRGPQGTLFGRNTTAGIIKFDTKKPTEDSEAYVSASYGSLGTLTAESAMGGAISDKVLVRASALYQRRSDWIDNDFTGEDDALGGFEEMAARLQVLFRPTEDLEALVNVHARSYEGTAAVFRANIITTDERGLNENFDRDTVSYNDTHNNPQEYDSWGTSLKLTYNLSESATITSITAYETTNGSSLGDIDGGNPAGPGFIPFQSSTEDGIDDLDQFTQELRVAVDASEELFYQFGFYYFDASMDLRTRPFFVPDSIVSHSNETWAVFGQGSYNLTDKTTVTIGVRYTDDKKSADAFSGGLGVYLPTVETSDDNISWDVAVNHAYSDDFSVYARIASGFRAPTIQSRDVAFVGNPSTAKSETIMSYEAGFKALFADKRFRWNAAVFYYDVSDLQVSAVGGATNSVRLESLDEVIGWGFETDIEYQATDNFLITAGLGFAHTKINDHDIRVPACGSGACTPLDPTDSDGFLIIDGNPLPQAPNFTLNLTAEYTAPLADGELFIFTDWAMQGKTHMLLYQTVEFQTSGTFEGGVRAGYRWNDGQYEAALFGRNITNEANLKGVIDFNNNTGYVNEPRVWGVALKANF
ncbi:TonB-dependent receptor [Kordiimonas pumila]|uniref:TonB-dependent receptor n=1 Tax=Kordiimonas pumila TaxID=2161677 RepID=A0ABV7D7X0_9PROT|nr:TonB-dependent receptor [Kordiimonas pumila]